MVLDGHAHRHGQGGEQVEVPALNPFLPVRRSSWTMPTGRPSWPGRGTHKAVRNVETTLFARMKRGSTAVSLMRIALPSCMTWPRIVRGEHRELGLAGALAERPQPRPSLGPRDQDEAAVGAQENGHQRIQGPAEHLVELGPATECPVDLENGLERLRRLDRAASQVVGAEVVEGLQNRRVALPRVIHLDGVVVEDQLVANDFDPAPIAQRNRLERRQPLAVELSATLALEVHQIGRAVGPVFDPGVMPGDADVIKVNVQARDAADVKVGPFQLVDPFRPPAADQLKCRAKRMRRCSWCQPVTGQLAMQFISNHDRHAIPGSLSKTAPNGVNSGPFMESA